MMKGVNNGAIQTAKRIPLGSIGVEIGVWKGDSSELFLERASYMHLVDPWSVDAYRLSDEHGGFREYLQRYGELVVGEWCEDAFQTYYDLTYESVMKRFDGKPVTIHRCTSSEFFTSTNNDSVDWVYIDGSHSFDGCLADLNGAERVATDSIFGDDYGCKHGVTAAVDAFINKTGLKLDVFGRHQYQILLQP